MKRNPAVILSHIIMGNIYCVDKSEDHRGSKSLMGSPIKNGYNSHFVLTNKKGEVYKEGEREIMTELALPNENQLVPAFITALDVDSCTREYDKWGHSFQEDKTSPSQSVTNLDCVIDFGDRKCYDQITEIKKKYYNL